MSHYVHRCLTNAIVHKYVKVEICRVMDLQVSRIILYKGIKK